MKISSRVSGVQYAIRDVIAEATKVEASGKRVLKLNIGDPNAYDFDTPDYVKKALLRALDDRKSGYADSQCAKELREAVAEKNKRKGVSCSPDDVVATAGLSEATNMLFACLVEKGDNALLPSPCYPQYESLARFYDGEPRFYECVEENNFLPDVDDLRKKIDSRTKAIVVINPNNPTGALYDEKILREIIAVAGEFRAPVISDEIYDEMLYGKPHHPTASLTKDVPVVTMNGLSKNYLAPGWRIGWIAFSNFGDDDLKEGVLRLCRLRLCAPSPPQYASAAALREENPERQRELQKLRARRDLTAKRLNEIEGISCVKPEGSFYAFPQIHDEKGVWRDDKQFVLELLREKGVLTVYGVGFAEKPGTKHFRIVFLPDEEILGEAFDKIKEFMKEKL